MSPTRSMRVILLLAAAWCAASTGNAVDLIVDSASVYLMRQEYARAKDLLKGVLDRDRTKMAAVYAYFTVRQTELLDYESYEIHGDRFVAFIDSAIELVETCMAERGSDSLMCRFYQGNLYGGKSIILAKCNRWMRAIKPAATSVSILRDVKKQRPDLRAALLGVGVFNYYLSQNLGWVPFFKDRTEEGLRDIRAATGATFPYNYAAMNSLCWVLIDRGKFPEADSVVDIVLKDYPDNTIFLRIKTKIAVYTQRHKEALHLGGRLVKLARRPEQPTNWSDLLMGYQVMTESHVHLGDTAKAVEVAREGLSTKVPPWASKISYVREHLSYLENTVATAEGEP